MRALHEYALMALVGTLVSAAFSYYADRNGVAAPGDAAAPESAASAYLEQMRSHAYRFWPVTLGMAVLLVMEVVQELGLNGVSGFRLGAVLNMVAFRTALRRLAAGQWPMDLSAPTESAEEQLERRATTAHAPPSSKQRAEAQANERAAAQAAYANERMAARHALRRLRVDHLVFGIPGSLGSAIEAFHELTGVEPAVGGKHPKLGTHNALVSIGNGAYFELLCRDPEQPLDGPEAEADQRLWMGMESLQGMESTMLTWATDRGSAIAQAVETARGEGYDPGDVTDFSRKKPDGSTLKWSLAYRHYTREQMGPGRGIVPFLIDWKGNPTPAAVAPKGCELVELRAEAVDVAATAKNLRALGIDPADLKLQTGKKDRLVATLRTPKGLVQF